MESGTASVTAGGATNATEVWGKLVAALGCSSAKSPIACVRSKDPLTIKSIIEHQALVFNPLTDGVTQIAKPEAARLAGNIAKVPTLQGTNAQEGRVFVIGDNDVAAFLNTTFPGLTDLQKAILAAYPISQALPTAYDVIAQIFTELIFQCVRSPLIHYYCSLFPSPTPSILLFQSASQPTTKTNALYSPVPSSPPIPQKSASQPGATSSTRNSPTPSPSPASTLAPTTVPKSPSSSARTLPLAQHPRKSRSANTCRVPGPPSRSILFVGRAGIVSVHSGAFPV